MRRGLGPASESARKGPPKAAFFLVGIGNYPSWPSYFRTRSSLRQINFSNWTSEHRQSSLANRLERFWPSVLIRAVAAEPAITSLKEIAQGKSPWKLLKNILGIASLEKLS